MSADTHCYAPFNKDGRCYWRCLFCDDVVMSPMPEAKLAEPCPKAAPPDEGIG